MWFVHKQVILTKDNLAKRKRTGPTRCSFCDRDETIKHLFLDCPLAKVLWWTVHIAFNITPPSSAHVQPNDVPLTPIQPSVEGEFRQHDGVVTMFMFYQRRASPKHRYSNIKVDYGGGGTAHS